MCGNGVRQTTGAYTEACDDGNLVSGDGCSSDCKTIEVGYYCSLAVPNVCTTTCGDGYCVPATEQCDDGNTINWDGCNSTCKNETGWVCLAAF